MGYDRVLFEKLKKQKEARKEKELAAANVEAEEEERKEEEDPIVRAPFARQYLVVENDPDDDDIKDLGI